MHTSLLDNFDTFSAMGALLAIIDDCYAYKSVVEAEGRSPDALLLKRGAMYITRMLRVFGVITQDDFGFPVGAGGGDYEANVGPMVSALVDFRDKVRAAAKASTPPQGALLKLCDELRDMTMVDLGVKVSDGDGAAVWQLADADALRKERDDKEREKADDAALKALNKLNVKKQDVAKMVAAAVPPEQWFKQPQFASEYSAFDDAGRPSKDGKGEELSKAALKSVDKGLQKQAKEHTKHQESLQKNPGLLESAQSDLAARRAEVEALVAADTILSDDVVQKIKAGLAS